MIKAPEQKTKRSIHKPQKSKNSRKAEQSIITAWLLTKIQATETGWRSNIISVQRYKTLPEKYHKADSHIFKTQKKKKPCFKNQSCSICSTFKTNTKKTSQERKKRSVQSKS